MERGERERVRGREREGGGGRIQGKNNWRCCLHEVAAFSCPSPSSHFSLIKLYFSKKLSILIEGCIPEFILLLKKISNLIYNI